MVVDELYLHGRLARSEANGPGLRSVIWTQGCSLACPGCFNPETHAPGGERYSARELADWAGSNGVEGVTISGGEPLEQANGVVAFARLCRDNGLSVVLLTGLSWRFLSRRRPELVESLGECVDVVLAGRYARNQHLGSGLRGSSNKTIELLSPRYSAADLERTAHAEIVIAPDGSIVVTGVDPLQLHEAA